MEEWIQDSKNAQNIRNNPWINGILGGLDMPYIVGARNAARKRVDIPAGELIRINPNLIT